MSEAGIEPRYEQYSGRDPLAHVISLNMKRRHLDESQRAMLAARIATLGDGQRQVGQLADVPTQEQAAEMLSVGERTVRRAREVLNEDVPEVISAVERGAVSVSAAANVARLPEPKQREIISTGTKPVTAAVRDVRAADQAPKMESRLKHQGERQAPFHNRRNVRHECRPGLAAQTLLTQTLGRLALNFHRRKEWTSAAIGASLSPCRDKVRLAPFGILPRRRAAAGLRW
jgi:hypothetical protein